MLSPRPLPETTRFEHLTSEQGLSNNRVLSILKDHNGFMWFGTFDGLNRYDGYEFRIFKHEPEDANSPSANVIQVLYQDRDGTLWFGTVGGGLNRFDLKSEQFTRFRHDPDDPTSLGSDTVFAIHQDRAGNLWVGTGDGGLNRYDPETGGFVRYQNDPDNPASLSHDTVRAIAEDEDGFLWIGTDGGGLNRFDPGASDAAFEIYRHDPGNPNSLGHDAVVSILLDSRGIMWLGLWGGGVDRIERGSSAEGGLRFVHHQHNPDNPASLSDNTVFTLQEGPSGRLWVGTLGGGLDMLDPLSGRFSHSTPDANDPYSLNHSSVISIFIDETGLLWAGTSGGGVDRLDLEAKAFVHYYSTASNPDGLNSNDIMGIFEDEAGVLWIGTGSGGLNRMDRQSETVVHYTHDPDNPQSLSDNMVREIVQDDLGMLWLPGRGGLNRVDPETGQVTAYRNNPENPASLLSDNVMTVFKARDGTIWVGSWLGLNWIDPITGEIGTYGPDGARPGGLGSVTVLSIAEDQDGKLWMGTFGKGLVQFDPVTVSAVHYEHNAGDPYSLADNTLWNVFLDSAGTLWLGTSSGLDRLDHATGHFVHYSQKDGLPAAGIMSILEDEESKEDTILWLSTTKGLTRFNTTSGEMRNYDASDGLQGNDFVWSSAFRSESGEMFFGGTNGLTAFYPSQISDNANRPPIVITDFLLANESVNIGPNSPLQQAVASVENLTLAHDERVMSLGFSALDYRAPEKNRYRYFLEGFDEEWTEVGSDRRFVTYTNLDPGDYVFRVLGSNNDGVWNEEGVSLAITITPPWWQTWWFRGGVLLLLVGLVAGGYVWQRAGARRRERQLEAVVAERTQDLGERVKELNCLYSISSLAARSDITFDEILQGTVALLPQAWKYPEIACARLEVNGQEYRTENCQDSDWRQSADIMVHGKRAGEVEVRYLESRPEADEGPFISEERLLLNAVAERLGRIIERIQAERTLQRRHSELSTILTVSREITGTLDLDALLELILTEAEQVITYDGAGILTLGKETLDFRYYRGIDQEANLLNVHIPIMTFPPFRELVLNGEPFIYDDLHDDPELAAQFWEATGFSIRALFGDCHSWLGVPLMAGGRVIGLLAFIHLQPGYYRVKTQELAQVFANQAAIAMENARLYQESRKAAVLEERTRLAGELHDSVTQTLYTSSLIAETLPDVWQRHPEEALRTLGDLRDLTQGALAEMRTLLLELRPGALAGLKLSELLHQLTAAMSARTDLPITTTVSGERSLPEDAKIALYRIAQEALNNISKHARASQAWVSLQSDANAATLRIRDNGRGFDPGAVSPHQMGLSIMRERAEAIGAALTVDSQPEQGTEVVVTWLADAGLENGGLSNDGERRTQAGGRKTGGGTDE